MARKTGETERGAVQNIRAIETGLIVLRAAYIYSRRAYHCHSWILALGVVEIRELCN
jgi:hypothetical protein